MAARRCAAPSTTAGRRCSASSPRNSTNNLDQEQDVMKGFVVHTIPGSPFARAVFATLEEKGAHYRVAPLTPQDMRGPRHLGLHPFGRMPILEHGDFRLYETQAIVRYIDRVLPQPALTPADPQLAARMDQLMNINDWYLFRDASAPIGFQRVVAPMLL